MTSVEIRESAWKRLRVARFFRLGNVHGLSEQNMTKTSNLHIFFMFWDQWECNGNAIKFNFFFITELHHDEKCLICLNSLSDASRPQSKIHREHYWRGRSDTAPTFCLLQLDLFKGDSGFCIVPYFRALWVKAQIAPSTKEEPEPQQEGMQYKTHKLDKALKWQTTDVNVAAFAEIDMAFKMREEYGEGDNTVHKLGHHVGDKFNPDGTLIDSSLYLRFN